MIVRASIEQKYKDLVQKNQEIIKYCQKRKYTIDNQMLNASLDMAVARFNTVLLQLIQHPLQAEQYQVHVELCQQAIEKFFFLLIDLDTWPRFTHWWFRWRLHQVGTKQIPQIRTLLNTIQDEQSKD